ncbi:hypothetical protein CK203_039574 [Vitis vinifera]|uniref:Uncharacterized protein n=1 Tax=Vitis vinifera TaxID=29760 RepID=A0A438HFX0_VITVI|nr:hypothetical protein CK203_039574 [Vitis vinifera]
MLVSSQLDSGLSNFTGVKRTSFLHRRMSGQQLPLRRKSSLNRTVNVVTTVWIEQSHQVSRLGLSNPSDIVEEENFSLLVLDDAYLDPNGVIPYGLYVCPNRPKGCESTVESTDSLSQSYITLCWCWFPSHVPPPKCSGGALPLPVSRRRIRSPGRPPLPESHLHPHPLLPQQSLLPVSTHHLPLPQISHLYLLDFAGPPDFLPQVSPNVPQVTVLDHHKTALQLLQSWNPSNALKVIDVGRSGATIAFDYFKQRAVEEGLLDVAGEFERVRRVFEYVEDGDLWRWGLENSKAFSSGLNDMNLEFDVGLNPSLFDQLLSLDLETVINEGMVSLSKKQVLIDEALEQSYEIALGGGTFGHCLVNFIYFF